MQVGTNYNSRNSLKFSGFYEKSADLEKNIILSRALVDLFGSDIPWVMMANNNVERVEKARRVFTVFALAFLSPIVVLPLFNRGFMKWGARLSEKFFSDNHKAVHISNKYLTSAEKMKEGLEKLSKDYSYSPLEWLYAKIRNKKLEKKPLDFQPLIDKCGGDYEKLRKKIINTKCSVMFSDFLFSSLSLGTVGFANNLITKKQTGQSGFSAEMSMADKEIVEKRAQNYEKNWKKRYAVFLGLTAFISTSVPLAIKKGLNRNADTKFSKFVHKHASKFDYTKGIYMSRWALLLGSLLMSEIGNYLSTRSRAELKDSLIRYISSDALYFGGDVALSSIFAGISDKLFGTELVKNKGKFFAEYKSLQQINDEVNSGLIKPKNKTAALCMYWGNLALVTAGVGFAVPALANAVTRNDVKKDVKKYQQFDNTDFLRSQQKDFLDS